MLSMTGFGRASGATGIFDWAVEIKSVNGRAFDLRMKLPPPADRLESAIKTRVAAQCTRGSLQLALSLTRAEAQTSIRLNEALLDELVERTGAYARRKGVPAASLDVLLGLRGVVEIVESEEDADTVEALLAAILSGVDEAVAALRASRAEEGRALFAILSAQLDAMEATLKQAIAARDAMGENIRQRLQAQVAALLETSERFDPQRLHQEAVLLAARADIREELDRALAHIASARALMEGADAVGRRLDFLAQELVRETNTICSKAADLALTAAGLELKTLVEQFREQVQNVE